MANKVVVNELPPFFLAGCRFVCASIFIFIIARLLKFPLKISKAHWRNTALSGFFFLTLGNGLAVMSLKYLDSGFSSVVIAAQPLVLLVMMRILDKKPIKIMSLAGVSLGMLGIYLLVSQDILVSTQEQWFALALLMVCLISWGYGSLFVGKADLPKNAFITGAYQMAIGGSMMLLISLILKEDTSSVYTLSINAIYAMIYLIIFGSVIAFTSFNYLLKRISPEKVATSTYINPIVALFCGWFFLDEVITPRSIFATLILFAGVYFINTVRFDGKSKVISTSSKSQRN
jgi:drug/metabolite transporter (DMT)-like permease